MALNEPVSGPLHIFLKNGQPLITNDAVGWCRDEPVDKLEGLEGLRFHDLRQTWKTKARRSGMDPEIRESFMGHSTRMRSVSER
jgi:integrase